MCLSQYDDYERAIRFGWGGLRSGWMVRGAARFCCLAQSRLIRYTESIPSFPRCPLCNSVNLALAKAGLRCACSACTANVRLFPPAGRSSGPVLGTSLPLQHWFGFPFGLLHRRIAIRVACWRPLFVGLHDSMVVGGVCTFCAALPVSRRAGKCLHRHLTPQRPWAEASIYHLTYLTTRVIVWLCQLGWFLCRLPRLERCLLAISFHLLNPLLATLPRNRSDSQPHRRRQQRIARSFPVPLTPLFSIFLPTPTH